MKVTTFIAFCLLATLGLTVRIQGEEQPVEQVTFPKNGTILCLPIPNYTSPGSQLTNCYIIAGATGQAIVIDPADELDPIDDVKLLVDKETGKSKLVTADEVAQYKVVARNDYSRVSVVQDPKTGKDWLYYDKFRTTNNYGPKILQILEENKLKLKYIVISHGHLDHFGALTYLKEKTGAEVLMHEADQRALDGAKLTKQGEKPVTGYPKDCYRIEGVHTKIDRCINDGEMISLDGMVFRVIHTPGHSPGGICLFTRQGDKPILFSADSLLHWGYLIDKSGYYAKDKDGNYLTDDTGRTNFSDGSGDQKLLYRMVGEKLLILPPETVVYPGHNEVTTIGEERKYSPARFLLKTEAKEAKPEDTPAAGDK